MDFAAQLAVEPSAGLSMSLRTDEPERASRPFDADRNGFHPTPITLPGA